jgi:hypothetical protein
VHSHAGGEEALEMHSTSRERGARLAGGGGGVLSDYALGRVVQHSPPKDSITHAASHVITPVSVLWYVCVFVCARARACLRARSCLFVHGRFVGERCTTAHIPCIRRTKHVRVQLSTNMQTHTKHTTHSPTHSPTHTKIPSIFDDGCTAVGTASVFDPINPLRKY